MQAPTGEPMASDEKATKRPAWVRDPISREFGDRVRSLRERTDLTLDQLAKRSGVSRAMLSKVERGEKSPTIGLAMRISHAVGGSLSALLNGEQPRSAVAVRRLHERFRFKDDSGLTREILSPTMEGSSVEVLRHTLPAGAASGVLPPYPPGTEKYVIVEKGELVLVRGRERILVRAGDTLFFEADVEHAFETPGEETSEYLVITSRCLLAMPAGTSSGQ